MRARSAYALGKLGSVKAVDALVAALSDVNIDIRREAVKSLGWIGDRRAIAALEPLLVDADGEMRTNTAEALLALGYDPKEKALDTLIANLHDNSLHVRIETILSLKRIADPYTISALIQVMKLDEQRGARHSAAEALGTIGEKRVIQDLLICLNDEDEFVRGAVVAALEKLVYQSGPEK
jgi:HEAT repeat protein